MCPACFPIIALFLCSYNAIRSLIFSHFLVSNQSISQNGLGIHRIAVLRVEKSKLGLEEEGMVDVINVKCEPDMVGLLTQTYGFLPGYHMNKKYWITMLLDGTVSEAKILDFLDMSYDLIDGKKD